MRWALGLGLVGLLAAAAAASAPLALDPAAAVEPESSKPAPELARLDRRLVEIQEAAERGRVAPDRYKEFVILFRADLEAVKAAAAPSPANIALHARILSRLGESEKAAANLARALKRDSGAPALRVALSQVRFDERNYPAALAEANAALKLDPANREALTLKHFSEGRVAMGGAAAEQAPPAPAPRAVSRKIRVARRDPMTLPFKLPVKIARGSPPPDLVIASRDSPPKGPGPLPLLSLAGAASLGFAAFGVARSRGTYESKDGLDDAHPAPVGRGQRFVAGALLSSMAVSAAPAALVYATSFASQGLRLTASQVGAINPSELKAANEIPKTFARVIPYTPETLDKLRMLGPSNRMQTFVTAAEDIVGLNAQQLQQRLGIERSAEYIVIRFLAPKTGVSSPIIFDHPEFIGKGLTSGGAREFYFPNGFIPADASIEIVK